MMFFNKMQSILKVICILVMVLIIMNMLSTGKINPVLFIVCIVNIIAALSVKKSEW